MGLEPRSDFVRKIGFAEAWGREQQDGWDFQGKPEGLRGANGRQNEIKELPCMPRCPGERFKATI